MDDVTYWERFEREVRLAMQEHGISREEATLLVGLRLGEVHGDGDLVCLHPLTPEQRRAIGLDHDPEQVIARDLAEQAKEASSESQTSVADTEAPVVSSGVRRP